jgi:signal transduction histidine kinase
MLTALIEGESKDPADVATTLIAAASLDKCKMQPTVRELAHLQRALGNDPKVCAVIEAVVASLAGLADEQRTNVGLARLADANIFGVLDIGPDGKVRDVNATGLRILALRRRSIPYLRLTGVFADDENARRVQQAIDAQEPLPPERGDVQTVDSGRATVDFALVPNGDGATLFLYDVTRTAVRDADADSNAFRARMLSILAHDLRTPLAAVVANAQRLAKQPDLPPTINESVARMLWSAERMRRLLNDLVELASVGAGEQFPIARDEVDVGAIASSVIAELREEHPDRAIVFHPDGNLRGRWDADRLAQAISNITRHALRQGANDANIEVAMTCTDESVAVAVATRRRDQPSGPNAGVGFYVAQQIVAAHGGLIEVQTRDGALRFTARLPRAGAS